MATYTESAVFRVVDEASGPLRKIDAELKQLAKSAQKLKGAIGGAEGSRGLVYMQSFARDANAEATKLRRTLANVNTEMQKLARSGMNLKGLKLDIGAGQTPAELEASRLASIKVARQLQSELAAIRTASAAGAGPGASTVDKAALDAERAQAQGIADARRQMARVAAQAAKEINAADRLAAKDGLGADRLRDRAINQARAEAGRQASQAAREARSEAASAARQAAAAIEAANRAEVASERQAARAIEQAERDKARAMQAAARAAEQNRHAWERNAHGFMHGLHLVDRAAMYQGGSAFVAAAGLHHAFEQASDYYHQLQLGRAQGLSDDEIRKLDKSSFDISQRNRLVRSNEALELGRGLSNILPNREEALEALPQAARLFATLRNQNPKDSADETKQKVEAIYKGLEEIGVTRDPATTAAATESIARAMNTMGKQFDPRQFMMLAKYSRAAGMRADADFMTEVGVVLGQELRGSSAGTGLMALYSQFAKDYKNGPIAERLFKEGLYDRDGMILNSKGKIVGTQGGKVKDFETLAGNPLHWMLDTFLPTVAKNHRIDLAKIGKEKSENNKLMDVVSKEFGTRTAQQIADIFGVQFPRILKEIENMRKAKGTGWAELSDDPAMNMLRFNLAVDEASKGLGKFFAPAVGNAAASVGNVLMRLAGDLRDGRHIARDAAIAGGLGVGALVGGGKLFGWLTGLGPNTGATVANTAATNRLSAVMAEASLFNGGKPGLKLAAGVAAGEAVVAGEGAAAGGFLSKLTGRGLLRGLGATALRYAGPAGITAIALSEMSDAIDTATSADSNVYSTKDATPDRIRAELAKARAEAAKLDAQVAKGEIGGFWPAIAKHQIDDIEKYLTEAYQHRIVDWLLEAKYTAESLVVELEREHRRGNALSNLQTPSPDEIAAREQEERERRNYQHNRRLGVLAQSDIAEGKTSVMTDEKLEQGYAEYARSRIQAARDTANAAIEKAEAEAKALAQAQAEKNKGRILVNEQFAPPLPAPEQIKPATSPYGTLSFTPPPPSRFIPPTDSFAPYLAPQRPSFDAPAFMSKLEQIIGSIGNVVSKINPISPAKAEAAPVPIVAPPQPRPFIPPTDSRTPFSAPQTPAAPDISPVIQKLTGDFGGLGSAVSSFGGQLGTAGGQVTSGAEAVASGGERAGGALNALAGAAEGVAARLASLQIVAPSVTGGGTKAPTGGNAIVGHH